MQYLDTTTARQVVYLSGIANDHDLSVHLRSRRAVENVLGRATRARLTVLRASIIIGSGSASFEIIRDLVEKLPVMVTPRWLNSRCQPIGVRDIMFYLTAVLDNPACFGRAFDVGGPDVLTYRQMLLGLAAERGYRRWIVTVPVLTPRLSSWWLYLVTSTTFSLAQSLVESLKNDTVCDPGKSIGAVVPHAPMSYREALALAFTRIEQNEVVSSWSDALSSGTMRQNYMDAIQIPKNGMFFDRQLMPFRRPVAEVLDNIWRIGGDRGWYKTDWLWRLRGLLDKAVGGVGLRRGRRSPSRLRAGDPLDFWRVLVADKRRPPPAALRRNEAARRSLASVSHRGPARRLARRGATGRLPPARPGRAAVLVFGAALPRHHLQGHGEEPGGVSARVEKPE